MKKQILILTGISALIAMSATYAYMQTTPCSCFDDGFIMGEGGASYSAIEEHLYRKQCDYEGHDTNWQEGYERGYTNWKIKTGREPSLLPLSGMCPYGQ